MICASCVGVCGNAVTIDPVKDRQTPAPLQVPGLIPAFPFTQRPELAELLNTPLNEGSLSLLSV